MDKRLDELMQNISEFTTSEFGQTKESILQKLNEELGELKEELDSNGDGEAQEFIDCFHLMLDYAYRLGMKAPTLIALTQRKLEINRNRDWELSGGTYKHKEKV